MMIPPNQFSLPKIIAHRGDRLNAPENTLRAFGQASQLGAKMVEFDVSMSADHVPIICHDLSAKRTTGHPGAFVEMDFVQIKALQAEGEQIPSLQETLQYLLQQQLAANVELKACHQHFANDIARIAKLLKNYDQHLPAMLVSSFQLDFLRHYHALNSDHALGLLFQALPVDWLAHATALDAYSVHLDQRFVQAKEVIAIKQAGYKVLVYTVNDIARAERLFSMGVDAIFTDSVAIMLNHFKEE